MGNKEKITSELVDRFLEISKDQWGRTEFTQHILNTIKESNGIQDAIKDLVWKALKDRFMWVMIGLVIFIGGTFVKSYVEHLAEITAEKTITVTKD